MARLGELVGTLKTLARLREVANLLDDLASGVVVCGSNCVYFIVYHVLHYGLISAHVKLIVKFFLFFMIPYPIVELFHAVKHRTSGGEGFLNLPTYFHHLKQRRNVRASTPPLFGRIAAPAT